MVISLVFSYKFDALQSIETTISKKSIAKISYKFLPKSKAMHLVFCNKFDM